ncbi:MAG TPA: FAD-dependent monooxygenase [Vicinamibacterales bacterium]|nr:FAD-dependent monooxygenase [Vicinamibacterales bacterium]
MMTGGDRAGSRVAPGGAPAVLVVGAGPTGLALALWLARLGVAVRIIDKTPGPAPYSRALGIQARTLEFYRQMGIAGAVLAGGVKMTGVNLWVKGQVAAHVPFGNVGTGLTPFPFIVDFAQGDHERWLSDCLAACGTDVERETTLLGFEPSRDGVHATIARADGTEEIVEARWIAGCDGAHSTVREQTGIGFPGGTYPELFYVADVLADGPAANGEVNLDLSTTEILVVFPMQGAGRVRLVGTVRADPGADLTFEDIAQRPVDELKLAIRTVNWFSPYRVHHRVANRFRNGRAFLLGDAGHIHSPVGAQGMNTGIGDAVNLAWKIADVVKGRARESLLDSYEPERIAFARQLVDTTDRVFTFVTKPGFVRQSMRTWVLPRLAPLLMRAPAVRQFVFRTVSQIGIQYRESPLSEGAAGAVQGGDRLPWVPLPSGDDNFSPLTSLAWQVHVYGEPRAALVQACASRRIPLHGFPWVPAMDRCGLIRDAAYLVRPDGYVAMADRRSDPRRLTDYFDTQGLRPGARATSA